MDGAFYVVMFDFDVDLDVVVEVGLDDVMF